MKTAGWKKYTLIGTVSVVLTTLSLFLSLTISYGPAPSDYRAALSLEEESSNLYTVLSRLNVQITGVNEAFARTDVCNNPMYPSIDCGAWLIVYCSSSKPAVPVCFENAYYQSICGTTLTPTSVEAACGGGGSGDNDGSDATVE